MSSDEALLEISDSRFNEIKAIENDISNLHEISHHLKEMVVEQGGTLEDIESHITSSTEYTGEAVVQLKEAERYGGLRNRVAASITAVAALLTAGAICLIVARKPERRN